MLKLYRKNGITLITLIAIVMVSIILLSTIVVSYSSFKTNARKKAFATEIYTIEKQVEEYKLRNNEYPIISEVQYDLDELDSELVDIISALNEDVTEKIVKFYTIDLSKLNLENISRGVKKAGNLDIYVISKKTGNVYYLIGEEIENETYYNFNAELYDLLKIK